MEKTCEEVFRHRRSYYALSAQSPATDARIEEIVRFALKHTPSAFNSQTTRLVLLLHEHHAELWKIVKRALRAVVPEEAFARTAEKVDRSFAAGYGTVLFYEDMSVIRTLQQRFPLYAGNFPMWAEHASAMHQLTVWTLLESAGLGASLQHYNPLIDKRVRMQWHLPEEWRLIAQMPFGMPAATPQQKTFEPVDARMRVFR
ncbi:MAG: nitroreductase family protein [Alistipes sp.]|nr:nitroreductase family protein [Alistipes senegalensis]MCM1250465.1 nitroreductase family protein [Alistipes sp.]